MSSLERFTIALVLLVGVLALAGGGYLVLRRREASEAREERPSPERAAGPERERGPGAPPPAAAIIPAVAPPPAGAPVGSVGGRVVDAVTQGPVAGSDVTAYVYDRETRAVSRVVTDVEGRFMLGDVPARGGVWLVAGASGYAPGFCERLAVVRDQMTDAGVLLLSRGGGGVEGVIREGAGGGLAGAEVRLLAMVATGERTQSLAPVASLVTGADGRFAFTPLAPGRHYTVMATKAGYAPATQAGVYVGPGAAAAQANLSLVRVP